MLGIRPEHVRIVNEPGQAAVRGQVFMTELLGRDTLVDVRSGEQRIRALVPGDAPVPVGQNVWVEFQPEYVHLFDAGTEARLPDLDSAGSAAAAAP